MISRRFILSLLLGSVFQLPLLCHANELVQASERMCQWVKGCAIEQMKSQNMTPETKAMMQPMIDSMCINMQKRFSDLSGMSKNHPLFDKATACMNSLSKLPCAKINDPSTPECVTYRKDAQKYANSNTPAKP